MKRRAKIVLVSSAASLAGAERALLELVSRLDQTVIDPIVVVPRRGLLSEELAKQQISLSVMDLGVPHSRRELQSPKLLWRLIQVIVAIFRLMLFLLRQNADIVHSNSSGVLAGAFAARLLHKKHIWHVREFLPKSWIGKSLLYLIPRLSHRGVCISGSVMQQFCDLPSAQSAKLCIVHDGIDIPFFARYRAVDTSHKRKLPKRVGTLSRINSWKGHDTFVRAASLITKSFPDVDFYIAGGCLREYLPIKNSLITLVSDLGLASKVRFVGELTYPELAQLLSTLDVLVLPSSSPEPSGLVILEAMAEGKPVVATNQGGPLEIVQDNRTGLLVPPNDPQAMAGSILSLLQDEQSACLMGESGFKRVQELFSIERHVSKIQGIYQSLLNPGESSEYQPGGTVRGCE